ncbi:hypothetical protein TRVL_08473 [Trypanosoma vivax]|nr:hypothetical protein TRVL_08473 [Trypanosoma vivax]
MQHAAFGCVCEETDAHGRRNPRNIGLSKRTWHQLCFHGGSREVTQAVEGVLGRVVVALRMFSSASLSVIGGEASLGVTARCANVVLATALAFPMPSGAKPCGMQNITKHGRAADYW